eukprot:Em0021g678a
MKYALKIIVHLKHGTVVSIEVGRDHQLLAVASTSGQQQFSQWIRPHFWFVVYADPFTCGTEEPATNHVIEYTLVFLNPDSNQMATDHFGEEQRGLLTFYCILLVVYIAGVALYVHTVWRTIKKRGPMHETLKMLSVAMGLHFASTLLMFLYLWSFSFDGEGLQFLETFSALLEELAQCHTVWMLLGLSAGWTLHLTADIRDNGQLMVTATLTLLHVILVLWERSYKESHYTFHIHESPPGWLMAVLRLVLVALFANNLHDTVERERSTLKKDFYRSFSIWCYLWFLSFPALMVLTMVLPEYWRHRAMTIGGIVIQTAALSLLSRLFLTRSLYWEVSTLSSTTLPFKRDRGS